MDRVTRPFFLIAVIMVTATTAMRSFWSDKSVEEWGIVLLLISTLLVVEWEQWRERRRSP